MRVSYNWLKSLVPDLAAPPITLAEKLTLHSFETEVVGSFSTDPKVVIAEIVAIDPHPDADRLQLATVNVGGEQIRVVCGAPNIAVGARVPFSPPGTKLLDENGEAFTLRPATIRGVESPGMLNSPRELGLGETHDGIYLLPSEGSLGDSLAQYIPDDVILETDITPNRAHDCLSHLGLAREVAALYGLTVREPQLAELPSEQLSDWGIDIEDARDTPRYLMVHLREVQSGQSPFWVQARLWAAGAKPISAAVDATNYALLEMGQPTHVFDVRLLPGATIGVRRAAGGETVKALDEEEWKLTTDDLVVTSDDEPVAIAGVMGGLATGVTDGTREILLEVANFRPYLVQETSRRLGLRSESSWRFSKGIEPERVELAARRVVQLLSELTGAQATGMRDSYAEPRERKPIAFDPERVSAVVGAPVPANQSQEMLARLRMQVETNMEPWQVSVPPERLDLTGSHDLIEEVVRMIGLDTVAASDVSASQPVALPHHVYWREVVRDVLVSLGMTETYNVVFEPQQRAALLGADSSGRVEVENPPAPELAFLRPRLLPGLLGNLSKNRELLHRYAGRRESALFELGNVYQRGDGGRVPGVVEQEYLAGVIVGGGLSPDDVGRALAEALGLDEVELQNVISDEIREKLKFRVPVTGFELNLTALLQRVEQEVPVPRSLDELREETGEAVQYEPLPKYPAVYRDISVLVAPAVSVEQVQEIIERVGGTLVVDVDLFDEFEPAHSYRRSYAFHVAYQSSHKTLTSEEVGALHEQIVAALQQELGVAVRE